jgi:predicted alpha/beta superfamily hydrolase
MHPYNLMASGLALFCALAPAAPVFAATVLELVQEREYVVPNTHELLVRSQAVGRTFVILVSVPSGPFVESGKKLPAIYALDGGYGIAGPIGQLMTWSGSITPAFIVSVSHPTGDPNRDHDLLHTPTVRDGVTIGGGGEAFATFLTDELQPFLENRYPLDPAAAVLFGHSLAGLFAAKVLASAPESFAGFIIASPATWADPQIVVALQKIAARGRDRPIFLAAGQHEPSIVEGTNQLAAALQTKGATFKLAKQIFPDATHISYWPELVPAAYRHVLPAATKAIVKRVPINLNNDDLERIAGVYEIGDGRTITITVRESRTFAVMTGTPQTEILPTSAQVFFAPVEGFDVTFRFEGPAGELAQAVVLSLNGAKTRAVRARR